tara:strand:- start:7646 stop:7810 length:165 start_codon:yes stop_codon:yes gene_type:complete
MSRKKQKYYFVRSKVRNYQYGVFSFCPDGKKKASLYLKTLAKEHPGDEFFISEK